MKRYISAEKLKAEIERLYKDARKKALTEDMSFWTGFGDGLDAIEQFIDSIQQEQPELPDNLDEAARDYGFSCYKRACFHPEHTWPSTTEDAFEAGAEWMAGQGETFESTVLVNGMGDSYIGGYYLTEKIPEGDKVLVQIRKK